MHNVMRMGDMEGRLDHSPQQMCSCLGRQAKPTKDALSKWASEEWSLAKASQLSDARREAAPTLLITWKLRT